MEWIFLYVCILVIVALLFWKGRKNKITHVKGIGDPLFEDDDGVKKWQK